MFLNDRKVNWKKAESSNNSDKSSGNKHHDTSYQQMKTMKLLHQKVDELHDRANE